MEKTNILINRDIIYPLQAKPVSRDIGLTSKQEISAPPQGTKDTPPGTRQPSGKTSGPENTTQSRTDDPSAADRPATSKPFQKILNSRIKQDDQAKQDKPTDTSTQTAASAILAAPATPAVALPTIPTNTILTTTTTGDTAAAANIKPNITNPNGKTGTIGSANINSQGQNISKPLDTTQNPYLLAHQDKQPTDTSANLPTDTGAGTDTTGNPQRPDDKTTAALSQIDINTIKPQDSRRDIQGIPSQAQNHNTSIDKAPLANIAPAEGLTQNGNPAPNKTGLEEQVGAAAGSAKRIKNTSSVEPAVTFQDIADGAGASIAGRGGAPANNPTDMQSSHTAAAQPAALSGHTTAAKSADNLTATRQIADTLASVAKPFDHRIEVALYPPELGRVRINLQLQDGFIDGVIEVQKAQTRTDLQRNLPDIIAAMEQNGIHVRRVDIIQNHFEPDPRQNRQGFNPSPDGMPQQNHYFEQNPDRQNNPAFLQPQTLDIPLNPEDYSITDAAADGGLNVYV